MNDLATQPTQPTKTSIVVPIKDRIVSIDVLRGLVMMIMALDHVRDFFHGASAQFDPLDLRFTSVPIFLTRWITHYCAPVFVFLAGTSAFLILGRKGEKGLSKFLFTRGLWLIIAEVTIINFGWDFVRAFSTTVLQVIWALGISMIVLSVLVYLPRWLLLTIAFVIIFGHNMLDNIRVDSTSAEAVGWSLLHQQRFFTFGSFRLLVIYPVLPWIGVMTAGFCFGEIYGRYQAEQRRKLLAATGVICMLLFIALRYSNFYGDPSHWSVQKSPVFTLLSFVNTTKYPPSLLYLLMTLGPAILFLSFAEKPLNKVSSVIAIYGRVPMFYYILHIYLIHVAFVIIEAARGFSVSQLLNNSIINPIPNTGFSLITVYIIWIAIVALLYPLCKRYDAYKQANKQKWWLSYL
jgi:uncharacterized membrane protein